MRLTTGSSKNYEVVLFIDHSMYGDILFGGFQNDSSWTFEAYSVSWGDDLNGRYVISYNVLLSRRPTWYLINIIFPVIFLSFTSPVVFLLPVDAGEKMGTSITVLLSFAVYLTIIADFLPETSITTSGLAVYLTIMLAICVVSFLLSAFIIRLHYRDPNREKQNVGRKWQALTRLLRLVTCTSGCSSSRNHVTTVTPVQNKPSGLEIGKPVGVEVVPDDEDIKWPDVAEALDWFLFLVFTLAIFLITVIIMGNLVQQADINREELKGSMDAGLMPYGKV